jgi:nicotinamidase-related amidase
MRTAYEKGYRVYTLKDCVAATSIEAQDATLQYNFGMFSVVTTSQDVMQALKQGQPQEISVSG